MTNKAPTVGGLAIAVVCMILPGCGNVRSSEVTDAQISDVSAGSDAGAQSIDAGSGDAAARCDPSARFGEPVLVRGINTADWEASGVFSADRMTIYFSANNLNGKWGIYSASRENAGAAFGSPLPLPSINTQNQLGEILSSDELTLYYGQAPAIGGSYDVYSATRADRAGAFGSPQLLLNVSDKDPATWDTPTWINGNGTVLYISSNKNGKPMHIYRATRASASGSFGTSVPVGEINSEDSEDASAVLTDDERTVFFYSGRPGGLGCWDVMTASRSSKDDGFGAPSFVSEINTPSCETPTWVSPDGCELLLQSDRPGGNGAFDLWLASRIQ